MEDHGIITTTDDASITVTVAMTANFFLRLIPTVNPCDTNTTPSDTNATQKRHNNDTGKQHTTGIYVSSTLIAVQPSVSAQEESPQLPCLLHHIFSTY